MRANIYQPSPGRLILQRLYRRQRDLRWEAELVHLALWDDIRSFHEKDTTYVHETVKKAA